MTDARCKNCKHWDQSRHQKDYGPRYNLGDCQKPVNVEFTPGGYNAIPPDAMGLDYPVCDLVTGPEFGCTLFEDKHGR